MAQHDPEHTPPRNAMRAFGEADRTDSFKERRNAFVTATSRFLDRIDEACKGDAPEINGVSIARRPGVSEIRMPRNPRVNSVIESVSDQGFYYFTDEKNRPRFQIVEKEVIGPEKVITKIWDIASADPLERMRFGPDASYELAGQTVDLATVSYSERDGNVKYSTSLEVRGDGKVVVGTEGSSRSVQDENEMFSGEHLLNELGDQFFGANWQEEA